MLYPQLFHAYKEKTYHENRNDASLAADDTLVVTVYIQKE